VTASYLSGGGVDPHPQRAESELLEGVQGLKPEEAAVMGLLYQRLKREQNQDQARLNELSGRRQRA
jgi:hypothetical protein